MKTEVLLQMIIISLLYQLSLFLHPTRNQPFPHPFRNLVFVEGKEISEIGNMGKSFDGLFFTEFIEERMSESLSSSDPAIWRIADQLFNKIEELVIGLREHLHEKICTFLKDFPLIFGKSYSESSYEGFIALTSYFVGVPSTLITSRMWLRLESAMKRGRPLSISSKMHPSDHMSICVE